MTKVPDLSGNRMAIVAMGRSNDQFVLAKTHSQEIDEVWAINAMGGVVFHDRMFMLDPASRFLDSEDAGTQTGLMRAVVKNHQGPIYTCELDDRCPGLVEFPLEEVVNAVGTWYLNNTVAYAIAFAIAAKVKKLMIYGVDFSYKGNVHFAEAGRACCEFILAKAVERGIQVGIAQTSSLLDTSLPPNEKLYGYHRLADQPVFSLEEDGRFKQYKYSEVKSKLEEQERVFFDSPPEAVRS
jgi:hypothetical protein